VLASKKEEVEKQKEEELPQDKKVPSLGNSLSNTNNLCKSVH